MKIGIIKRKTSRKQAKIIAISERATSRFMLSLSAAAINLQMDHL